MRTVVIAQRSYSAESFVSLRDATFDDNRVPPLDQEGLQGGF